VAGHPNALSGEDFTGERGVQHVAPQRLGFHSVVDEGVIHEAAGRRPRPPGGKLAKADAIDGILDRADAPVATAKGAVTDADDAGDEGGVAFQEGGDLIEAGIDVQQQLAEPASTCGAAGRVAGGDENFFAGREQRL